jgi:peptidoglycan/xylan/chitin deacetylase (PgdA/CDA1 family)
LLDVDTAMFRWQMNYLAANKFTVVSLDALVDALQGKGTIPARAVVLTFDDGWATQYENAFPILKQMHYPATFFVVTGQVGRAAYMGLDDLKRLQAAGMTIAAHTRTHPQLTKLSDAQMRDEIIGSRKDLQLMLGITTDLFAYPYGAHNTNTMAVVQEAGFRAAREMGGGAWNDATDRLALHSVLATNDMSTFARDLGVPLMAARRSRRFEVAVRHGNVAR